MAVPAIELYYELDCVCGDASIQIKNTTCTGDSLYFCSHCDKIPKLSGKRYCDDCGPYNHRKNKKGHSFNINSKHVVAVKDMLETKEDPDKASWGKQVIVAMVGAARYKKMEPYVDKLPVAYSSGVGGIVLYTELAEHFASNVVSKFATNNVLNMGAVATVAMSVVELGLHAYRWGTNQISGKEFVRQIGRVVTKNGAALGAMAASAKIGAMVGSAFCPGLGTAVGVCAGLLLGFLAGKCASSLYDKMFPNGEEAARKKCIEEALKYFHYQPKDIHNSDIFNTNQLSKRFKRFALDAHPDKRGGDHTEWHILSQHYGLLKSLCCQTASTKEMVNEILAIE